MLLALVMLFGLFAACTGNITSEDPTDSETTSDIDSSDTDNSENEDSETEDNSNGDEKEEIALDVDEALIIQNANKLANGVQAYFTDSSRTSMTFENLNMSLEYAVSNNVPKQVVALNNKSGQSYIQNTMDVFITMDNGKTYYGSKSYTNATSNIYRFGYYFYEMRFEEQLFSSDYEVSDTKDIKYNRIYKANHIESYEIDTKTKALCITNSITATDPYLVFGSQLHGIGLSADKYQFLKITMTADETVDTNAMIFVIAGEQDGFTSDQSTGFTISNDNQKHEYLIPLTSIKGYNGTLKGLRLDVSGPGAHYQIHNMELVSANLDGAPSDLGIARVFNTYSDKLHQVLQVAAAAETSGIKSIGFTTDIQADTVESLIIMYKDGTTVSNIADVSDWTQVVAVGFDIKNTGIFGYILPYDGKSGTISVTLKDGVYNVIQSMTPDNGTIIPSRGSYNSEKDYYNSVVPYNQNDFYMGNRIYTDSTHSFDDFLFEAYCETNPLNEKYINVSSASTDGNYIGYDALRGIYKFSIAGSNFNAAYYDEPNKHYNVNFSIKGDKVTRKVYMMTSTTSGALECAVLLDKNNLLLPVPMEVGKNFSEAAGERNLFNINDETYGETIFPMIIEADKKVTYTVVNVYQNWGQFPLKQISWIQFRAPYYHLSTGVTETNCILPWYTTKNSKSLNTLPDFRTMSAPFWGNQPQHNSCGAHTWLVYNDAEGHHFITSENTLDIIDSYGPTYVDVKMDYLSDDGKIKMSYTHTEMPQTDENRTYYEITYEVLEDVSINDFRNNFQFYSVYPNNPSGNYAKVGYLDENNQSKVVNSVAQFSINESGKIITTYDESRSYVLGDECPYFSFFDMNGADPSHQQGYANLAFLVYNYDFIIGGEKSDANFIINNIERKIQLSLDLGDVQLKKGDKFSINAILLPWGSQELDREYADTQNPDANAIYYDTVIDGVEYMDKNVRDVRENTLLNPVGVIAGENTKTIESVFVPKVKSTNGSTAEFTISGGHNNIAVRAYGFEKLTAPKIEEFVNGEWVEYAVSSATTPDKKGYLHYYDGYMVHYDGDGTFSYSFVIAMDNGAERKFRISAAEDFDSWPAEPEVEFVGDDLLDVFVDKQEIYNALVGGVWISDAVISEDGSYVSLYGTGEGALNQNGGKVNEGYLVGYRTNNAIVESGHLFVVKYRIPTTNTSSIEKFEIFTSTTQPNATGNNRVVTTNVVSDGEWHILVIDLSKIAESTFASEFSADSNGKYNAQFLRFDFFDKCMPKTDYIDIAYFGLDNQLEDIVNMAKDENENSVKVLTCVEGSKNFEYVIKTGEIFDYSAPVLDSLVHPDSDFTLSDLDYAACVDGINGKKIAGGTNSLILTTKDINASPIALSLNSNTISSTKYLNPTLYKGPNLVITGWTVVVGGVDRYVYSVDGGKTWQDCAGYNTTPSAVSTDHLKNAANRIGKKDNSPFTSEADKKNGLFQGLDTLNPKGMTADLSDYVGQTVHVIFAAVPAQAKNTLCPIAYVTDVKVVAQEEVVIGPTYNDYVKEGSGYSVSTLEFAACIDRIHSVKFGDRINSKNPSVTLLAYNGTTIAAHGTANNYATPGNYLVFSGWAIVRGGIEKYVWSADGGNTWNDVEFYGTAGPSTIQDAILSHDRLKNLGYTFVKDPDGKNCMFQAPNDVTQIKGLAANLEDFSGETVDVIFAAVPSIDTTTLCVIAVATGVQIP